MEFKKFDIKFHDLHKVATLIFETETELFSLLFGKNKDKALSRIKRVVQAGSNSFGHDYIYLAMEKNQILGLTIFYKGNDIDKRIESDKFSEALDFLGLIRLIFFEKTLINRLLTKNFDEKELYISNVCVDKNKRGMGIGKFLLDNVIKQTKAQHCKTIILDVSKDNHIAIDLYNKTGFKVGEVRTSLLWKITIYKMIKNV